MEIGNNFFYVVLEVQIQNLQSNVLFEFKNKIP